MIEAAIMDDIWYKLEYEQKKESMFWVLEVPFVRIKKKKKNKGPIRTCMRIWYYFYFGNSQDNNWYMTWISEDACNCNLQVKA